MGMRPLPQHKEHSAHQVQAVIVLLTSSPDQGHGKAHAVIGVRTA